MRGTELIINKEVERARIGEIVDSTNKLRYGSGCLTPFIKGQEDIEVLLYNPNALISKQPVELCGFAASTILNKAVALEEKLKEDEFASTFLEFTYNQPMVMSFPPEVIWNGKGLDHWEKSLKRFIKFSSPGFTEKEIDEFCKYIRETVTSNSLTHKFWDHIVKETFKGESISKLLMEWVATTAIKMRCKYTSGIVPIISQKTRGSVVLNHRVNLAQAALIRDMEEVGFEVPQYFYTIQLHPNMIKPDDWNDLLDEVVKNLRSSLDTTDIFSGIHVTIRDLNAISNSPGRIQTVMKLFEEINRLGHEYKLPVWWSNFGLIGLAALDEGGDFASFTLNMKTDELVAGSGGGPIAKEHQYGKILDINQKRLYEWKQVKKLGKHGHSLPKLNKFSIRNTPDDLELGSPPLYRKLFSKPYNTASMNELSLMWKENIYNGESKPGRHYLRDFGPTFNGWGLDK